LWQRRPLLGLLGVPKVMCLQSLAAGDWPLTPAQVCKKHPFLYLPQPAWS
jgi:hypothetical protein